MKRLTIRNSDGSVSQPVDLKWDEALERLAAYEDSGLTPDQVRGMMLSVGLCVLPPIDDERAEQIIDNFSRNPVHIRLASKIDEPKISAYPLWISTADMLPDVGDPVLIVRHSYNGEPIRVEPAMLRPNGNWQAIGHKLTQKNVSHWTPMPVPPQEGEICHTS